MSISTLFKSLLLPLHRHRKSEPDIFIFTLPRTGSSLLAEILNTDPKAKTAGEPFSLHGDNPRVLGKYFDQASWAERYVDVSQAHFQLLIRYLEALSQGKPGTAIPGAIFFHPPIISEAAEPFLRSTGSVIILWILCIISRMIMVSISSDIPWLIPCRA
jgi:hypothetical protein